MRNALLTAIYAHMQANPSDPFVVGIGDNYGVREGVENGPYPAAVSFIVSDVPDGELGSDSREFEWQMSVYAKEHDEAEALAEACRNLFSGQGITAAGCSFLCVFNGIFGPMREDDAEPWMCAVTFES